MIATSINSSNSFNCCEPGGAADGVFDVPPSVISRKDEVVNRVADVSQDWRWGMVDEVSLGIIIPANQDPLAISKQRFVALLEFCEEDLGLERVIAVFEKPGVSLEHGFARTLRYIGFRVMSPDVFPDSIDSERFFAMSYVV